MLETLFTELLQNYTTDKRYIESLWHELLKKYSGSKRHYHNLSHLEAMFRQLNAFKMAVQDWNTILFSLFYHDAVYNPLRPDNEEKSAALALKRLQGLLPAAALQKCRNQILATKQHAWSNEADTNIFTDADLSVLGQNWVVYAAYLKNIRKEYAVYPDFVYNNGRKKVLTHFLDMKTIFKTAPFVDAYEQQARENIRRELGQL